MSYAIDPKAGTHFTGKIFVTPHALDRAVEHFGISRGDAPAWVMERLRKAALIDPDVIDDNGNSARMFTYNRTIFIVAADTSTVITLHPQQAASDSVRSPIERILQRAVKAAQRKEARETKRISIEIAELTVQRANYELRRAKSESLKVIADMNTKIQDIDRDVAKLQRELFEIRREKKTIMKSVSVYV